MTTMWAVHSDRPQLDFVGEGFVAIGWDALGDLSTIGDDRDAMKSAVVTAYPSSKPGAIPGTAGMLLRFAFRMAVGDLIVYPYKPDSTLNFGRIASDYYREAGEALHPNRRKVEWLKTGVPRTTFTQSARYEVGSALTVFKVQHHAAEFLAFIDGTQEPPPDASLPPEEAADAVADEPNAERIETYTRDFVVETLLTRLEGVAFEHFVAHLLEAMGYNTQVTPPSADSGVDIIAHRDPLGLEPPIIKVQCKRTTTSIGRPDIQRLSGALVPGSTELGLFVTLGAYSREAQDLGRQRQDLRLVNGNELVDLVLQHYDRFSPEYKRLLPMRAVYVVDRESPLD